MWSAKQYCAFFVDNKRGMETPRPQKNTNTTKQIAYITDAILPQITNATQRHQLPQGSKFQQVKTTFSTFHRQRVKPIKPIGSHCSRQAHRKPVPLRPSAADRPADCAAGVVEQACTGGRSAEATTRSGGMRTGVTTSVAAGPAGTVHPPRCDGRRGEAGGCAGAGAGLTMPALSWCSRLPPPPPPPPPPPAGPAHGGT